MKNHAPKLRGTGLFLLLLIVLAGCGGSNTGPVSIAIDPSNPSLATGATEQLTAAELFGNNTKIDVTKSATWSSSNPGAATVSPTGLVTTVAPGTTTIRASYKSFSASTTITVTTVTTATLVSIAVTPSGPYTALGISVQFTAFGTYSDNTV